MMKWQLKAAVVKASLTICEPITCTDSSFYSIFFAPVGFNGTLEFLHLFKVSMDFQKSNMDIVIARIYELDTFYVQR
jgi:hypothetical protein